MNVFLDEFNEVVWKGDPQGSFVITDGRSCFIDSVCIARLTDLGDPRWKIDKEFYGYWMLLE